MDLARVYRRGSFYPVSGRTALYATTRISLVRNGVTSFGGAFSVAGTGLSGYLRDFEWVRDFSPFRSKIS